MPDKNTKYRITIRNWDKYQSEMKGTGKRRRRRDWVAISTNVYRDPDFFELTVEQRYLWLMLLLHAGCVGHVFELSTSSARVLFQLRPGWRGVVDFEALRNQGFIDLQNATGQDSTGQYRQDISVPEKPKPKKPKPKPEKPKPPDPTVERLEELKAIYPKRSGSQPWKRAMTAAGARMKDGKTWTQLADGVRRYALYCAETNKLGTEYVMMAATFFGPDEHFTQPWDPPLSAAQSRSERNLSAVQQAMEEDDAHE